MTMTPIWRLAACMVALGAIAAHAQPGQTYDVPLTDGRPYLHVIHEGRSVRVERIQDPDFELKGYFAKTARKCPPFCIHPMLAAPGVQTIGEVELFDFMEDDLRNGTGLLIDGRTPEWFEKGTIPGAISLPFTRLTQSAEDPSWDSILPQFGVKPSEGRGIIAQAMETLGLSPKEAVVGRWDFSEAKRLVVFCNGPACDQSPRAIKGLLAVGYPAEKLLYFRGGMQLWELWGLTTVVPGS